MNDWLTDRHTQYSVYCVQYNFVTLIENVYYEPRGITMKFLKSALALLVTFYNFQLSQSGLICPVDGAAWSSYTQLTPNGQCINFFEITAASQTQCQTECSTTYTDQCYGYAWRTNGNKCYMCTDASSYLKSMFFVFFFFYFFFHILCIIFDMQNVIYVFVLEVSYSFIDSKYFRLRRGNTHEQHVLYSFFFSFDFCVFSQKNEICVMFCEIEILSKQNTAFKK